MVWNRVNEIPLVVMTLFSGRTDEREDDAVANKKDRRLSRQELCLVGFGKRLVL